MRKIKVCVAGARGKMGTETVKALLSDSSFEFVGALDHKFSNVSVSDKLPFDCGDALFYNDVSVLFNEQSPDVFIDFSSTEASVVHLPIAISMGVRPVVGTTGFSQEQLEKWNQMCLERKIGMIVAPNFALGAILMMKFSQMAAKYFPNVEIIEMHHDQKLDSPSGTALKTLELISKEREPVVQGNPKEREEIEGSRGGDFEGMKVHSIRLPGLIAHQQVLFGGKGELLTIRHDSMSRESFMGGVLFSCKKVLEMNGLTYGLENILS